MLKVHSRYIHIFIHSLLAFYVELTKIFIKITFIMPHPNYPQSNVSKFNDYDPEKYALDDVSPTVLVDESLLPNRPPSLTQRSVGKFLQPLTRQLVEVPPRPTIDELPDAVIENMVKIDKAFWVDKPLHDAYYNYGMTTEKVLPPRQNPFPRSYQYDLDCVIYRRQRACQHGYGGKQLPEYCRKCDQNFSTKGAPSQSTFISDTTQRRWRYYPDLTAKLSSQQIRDMMMNEVGRPFKNDACSWYNENYPTVKYDCMLRKFSK